MNHKDNNKDVNDEDSNLFRKHVGKVKRLSHDRVINKAKPAQARRHPPPQDRPGTATESLSDDFGLPDTDHSENLFYAKTGLQPRTIKRLRQGKIDLGADLDLHGMTVDEARPLVNEFLEFCSAQHIRGALIIHGKGYRSGVAKLKSMVNRWLRQHPAVVAFCSAQPKDGGTGAVYVLIKQI